LGAGHFDGRPVEYLKERIREIAEPDGVQAAAMTIRAELVRLVGGLQLSHGESRLKGDLPVDLRSHT